MLGQLNMYGLDKVELAIERLRAYEPKEGYFLAFSGGKDSVVVKALCDMAGVKYDAHYNVTSVDPPELVHFIKTFPDVSVDLPRDRDGNRISMWNLIPKKKMPPTRLVRYCCEKLKEEGGRGRVTVTGVRWAESSRRKNNHGAVTITDAHAEKELHDAGIDSFTKNQAGGIVLNLDNADSRNAIELCYRTRKTLVNPIVDWEDEDVWEFIKTYNVPYCSLYDEGFTRLGCIGCPMSSKQLDEFERWPKYKALYLHAFDRMLQVRKAAGLETEWETAEEVFTWWTRKERQ